MGKFEEIYESVMNESTTNDVDIMLKHYLTTALWSSIDVNSKDESNLDDKYDIDDFSKNAYNKSKNDCKQFLTKVETELKKYNKNVDKSEQYTIYNLSDGKHKTKNRELEMLGHNFWLSRNGHGAGFFDGDYVDEMEKILTKVADSMGGVDLYVGDNGKIEIM